MSEYLGSAFASFVGNRKTYPPLPQPLQPHDQQHPPLPFAPLPLPQTPQVPATSHFPPPLTSSSQPCPPSESRPSKRLRCSQSPTVLIPDTMAPVPLISPVSILAPTTTPPFNPTRSTQPEHHPAQFNSSTCFPLPLSRNCNEAAVPSSSTICCVPQPSIENLPTVSPSTAAIAKSQSPCRLLKRPRDSPTPLLSSATEELPPSNPIQLSIINTCRSEPSLERVCNHCEARCRDQDHLLEHVKLVHQRPFACQVAGCSACFSKQNHLSRHIRIVHNKERPFACMEPGCSSRFGSKSHLGDHTRAVHMRLRNFKCGICDASWSKRFNLEKHIRIRHFGEKPFKCSTCNLSFGTRSHVTRHELKVHKQVNASLSRPH